MTINNIPQEGIDIPGPIDWTNASHYLVYDKDDFTVETWCKMGPDYRFRLRTRVRPMCESEVIGIKLIGHSREAVLKAFGIVETPPIYTNRKINKASWFRRILYILKQKIDTLLAD